MNKIQSVIFISLLVAALPLSVNAKAPLEGEPDWEARRGASADSTGKQTQKELLLQELKRLEEAEKAAEKRLEKDSL